jgi:hypothetical protein
MAMAASAGFDAKEMSSCKTMFTLTLHIRWSKRVGRVKTIRTGVNVDEWTISSGTLHGAGGADVSIWKAIFWRCLGFRYYRCVSGTAVRNHWVSQTQRQKSLAASS